MFRIDEDKTIHLTRGDIAAITVNATDSSGQAYTFKQGEVVRLKVFEKKGCECVELQKDVVIESETAEVNISLDMNDTKIGGTISRPKDYWYEVELNPETAPQTIIGYDDNGAKILKLYPEGGNKNEP